MTCLSLTDFGNLTGRPYSTSDLHDNFFSDECSLFGGTWHSGLTGHSGTDGLLVPDLSTAGGALLPSHSRAEPKFGEFQIPFDQDRPISARFWHPNR